MTLGLNPAITSAVAIPFVLHGTTGGGTVE
jgi:hypothetical protein